MRLDSRHCKQKSAELRGDLFKVEAELGNPEAFVKNEHIGIMVGRMAKVKIVPLDYSLSLPIKCDYAPRIASYGNL